jgi:hypothetical protein
MAIMFQDFLIEGYRPFERLLLPKLGHVNLLTGKNNVGKSSVLEAIYLHTQRFSLQSVLSVLSGRDEMPRRISLARRTPESAIVSGLASLFRGRPTAPHNELRIRLGPDDPTDMVTVTFSWYGGTDSDETTVPALPGLEATDGELRLVRPSLSIAWGHLPPIRLDVGRFARYTDFPLFEPAHCVYMSVEASSSTRHVLMWESIALTPLQAEVLNALRLVEPGIEAISPVSAGSSITSPYFKVKLNTVPEPMPLRALGEGINRVLEIALALVFARNGVLLLDEFENGIHYSVHRQLWRLIFRTALQLNVQVFATTHSSDCIRAFGQVAREEPTDGALIRLQRVNDEVVPTPFDEDDLEVVAEEGIEVR